MDSQTQFCHSQQQQQIHVQSSQQLQTMSLIGNHSLSTSISLHQPCQFTNNYFSNQNSVQKENQLISSTQDLYKVGGNSLQPPKRQFGKDITSTKNMPQETNLQSSKLSSFQSQPLKYHHSHTNSASIILSSNHNSGLGGSFNPRSEEFPVLPLLSNYLGYHHNESHSEMQIEQTCEVEFAADLKDPNAVSKYARKIFNYLRKTEKNFIAKEDYMVLIQNDINEKMRAILIDWLVDVHQKFRLVPETLFMTVNLIDRFLQRNQIPRQKLQLVGVASMFIACKYEEIYSPELRDFVYVCDNAYTKEQILECEGLIVRSLNFELTQTSSLRFFERYRILSQSDEKISMLSKYMLELALIDFKFLKYQPSLLAASSLYLACKLNNKESWNNNLRLQAQYEENQLKPCAKELLTLFQAAPSAQLQAVKRKYSSPKFLEVAKLIFEI